MPTDSKPSGSARDPLWYKDAIIYEIHVKAFADSNDDGVGDFPGLIGRLDYLQDLGITCIWLLPFFPSPLRDDGYDIADYSNVHAPYGRLEDFQAFLGAAHERQMQVVIELVVNHTSDQHPWFQRARRAPAGSLERDFYVWSDTDQKYRDARVIFLDYEKSNWTWDPEANAFYWHRFFHHQPDLNYDNPLVIQEIANVLRFWLDMGVDGLRIDAVPYLVEREGTGCENLPETHAVIRELRRQIDAQYANRMLLAEANQWPADVRAYFGDGDEAHMAFHFPLMPRIFMALHLEDRHPIVDIMRQTPPIPDTCQWALFLRNHDELTLEMVTDDERDYMYLAYSAAPEARLNLGIRRRLAPLMGNHRGRIELLVSLLFSLPGTPIIYYGDEIGMGDNIYLGDRNGVRTPMQWTADRNAGFSRANPARLYSPVIMDPVYGYQAVNVEAQETDPSSLLQWMRKMIALRKLFKGLGRGEIEFLEPANRKVLAYARRYENDVTLCVANLSRFVQPAELDLSAFAGMMPVEMLGYTEFPVVTDRPYFVTLAPYSFYWFELHRARPPVDVGREAELPEIPVRERWQEILEGRTRDVLEKVVLPAFLARQRWFAGKARKVQAARVGDWGVFRPGPQPGALVFLEIDYADRRSETYVALVGIATDAEAQSFQTTQPEAAVARVVAPAGRWLLHDAAADPSLCGTLVEAIEGSRTFRTRNGLVRAVPTPAWPDVRGAGAIPPGVLRESAGQTNTVVFYGERLILKLFRRPEPGINPDCEMRRHLVEQAGFTHVPRLAGVFEYVQPGKQPITLALVQEFVPNQGDAWTAAADELSRYYERCAARRVAQEPTPEDAPLVALAEAEPPAPIRDLIGISLDRAAAMGRRTAALHLALAAATSDAAFAPGQASAADRAQMAGDVRQRGRRVLDLMESAGAGLSEPARELAGQIAAQLPSVLDRSDDLAGALAGTTVRCHGNYHLAQLLSVEDDFVIIDFEGEPGRPLPERRGRYSPLRDVAAMLQSFGYAARAALFAFTTRRPDDLGALEPWATVWQTWTSGAFLRAYRAAIAGRGLVPEDPERFEALLGVLRLQRSLYEVVYEFNTRPAWVPVALAGLAALVPPHST